MRWSGLPNFKQLTKTEKIVNSAMLIAMLVVVIQLAFA
jgi:cell division protein FtsL